jgi:hypothetical protein
LISWVNLPESEATWEDAAFVRRIFPSFHPWGQGSQGGIVRQGVQLSFVRNRYKGSWRPVYHFVEFNCYCPVHIRRSRTTTHGRLLSFSCQPMEQ